jgi:hypothetical protein
MTLIPKGHSFVKPYPQPELNGALGLTSHDIARSLSTTPDVLRKAICNSKFEKYAHDARLNIRRILRKSDGRGRPEQVFIFDAEAAKVLVARYSSDLGFRYCHFLVRCEKVLLERLPELEKALYEAIRENEKLCKKILQLESGTRTRGKPGPKKGTVPVFMPEETLFPMFDDIEKMPLKIKKVFVPRESLSQKEILTNENISMTYCIDGMTKKMIKNQALIMYYDLPAHMRLKPAK